MATRSITMAPDSVKMVKKRQRQRQFMRKSVAHFLLILGSLVMIIPFIWTISTALKEEVNVQDGKWIPDPLTWDNFKQAWLVGGFGKGYRNSLIVGFVVTVGQVFTSALAAYAFARLKFAGRDKLFLGYLGTMMIPFVVIMIPNFILLKNLGLIDGLWAIILPAMFSAYGTFMLRQFFLGIPVELEEAAVIDGASKMGIFFTIIMPLSKAAIATLATFTFIFNWNDFMWPLIVIHSKEWMTLPILLNSFQGQHTSKIALVMAGSLIVLLPVIIVFIMNQRFITRGITLSGLKG